MRKSHMLFTAALIALAALVPPAVAAENGYSQQKVVYHINGDDPKQQVAALRNIQNHINAVGAQYLDLRVVMHGDGVSLVMFPEALARAPKMKAANSDEQMQAKIDGLRNQGVRFEICANTLQGRGIDRDNDLYMVEEADIVPSGVAQLAHLQSMGFTYIKP